MQTPEQKANTANDITPSFEIPDVAQESAKGDFANLKMVLTLVSLVALLVGYSYYRYSVSHKQAAKPSKSREAQEIAGKDWVLGKVKQALEGESQALDEPKTERPFPASKIKSDESRPIFKKKVKAFAKYKSIPTKTHENG